MPRPVTELERQGSLARAAELTDAEAAVFMPLYREYRRHVGNVNDELLAVLNDLARDYRSLTNDRAIGLTRRWLATERSRVELKERYAERFATVLSAVKTARVMQLENKLDILQMASAAEMIPLVDI